MFGKKEGEKQSLYHNVPKKQEEAMRKSITEGSMAAAAGGFGGSFITPFALALGSNSFHIGILSSFSGLIAPLGELFGSKKMDTVSRKKIIMKAKFLELIFWVVMMGLAYLAWKSIVPIYIPYMMIILYAIMSYIGGAMHPAWFSWMGDVIPQKIRGHYFGKRNRVAAFVGIITFLAGSFILDYISGIDIKGAVLLGFTVIFFISLLFKYGSRNLIGKIYDPPLNLKNRPHYSFWQFLKKFDNYGKLALFQSIFFFSIMISAPFFAVYMLEDLGFSYVTFTLVSLSSTMFFLFFTKLAGSFSDTYGNIKLIYLAGFIFPFVPVLWIFISNPIFLFILPGLLSGIANAAFSIGITDYTYELLKPEERGISVAYSSVLIGLGVFAGALIGGFLIQYISITFMNPTKFVFMISAIMMFITSLIFIPMLKEVRKTKKLKLPFHLHAIHHHHPFKGIHLHVAYYKKFRHQKVK